jgi:DNA (cytosine-5)-methyltransferase 1
MKPYNLAHMHRRASKKKFNVVSTFAGGGGSSIGYALAGGEVILANEISTNASETYKRNHPSTKMDTGNIKDFCNQEFNLGEVDILDGSPPCITFSVAKAQKREFPEENITETLVLDYVRVALKIEPKICVIENVQQFETAAVFHQTLQWLRNGGYRVNYKILNAVDFGLPQQRKRLFIVGVRNDIAGELGIHEDNQILDLFPSIKNISPVTVKEALSGVEVVQGERDFLLTHMRRSSHYEVLKEIPKNPAKKTRMSMLKEDWHSDFSLDRASWNTPCPTITSLGQQVGQGGICHPNEDRLFTIKELSRLMGLPDDYAMSGTYNEKAKTIGNMVAPVMMEQLAKSLYEKVLAKTKKRTDRTYVRAIKDYGARETVFKWKGEFLQESDLSQIIKITQDTVITTPTGIPIAWVVVNAFPNDSMREELYGIEGDSVMRANCSGPIDHDEMKSKGLVEDVDYKLRTRNSYFKRNKSGDWNRIAVANSINSVMIGSKRGRFTGRINLSNPVKWKRLKELCAHVENAFKKATPELYKRQKQFAEAAIEPRHRHGIITTISANRYSSDQTTAMSVHTDGRDVELTTMSCHRKGDYEGAYLAFPRWGLGIDLPDN